MKKLMFSAAVAVTALSAPIGPASAQGAAAFTVSQDAAADSERIALAQAIVDRQLPPGAMAEMMSAMFGNVMPALGDTMADLRVAEVARIGGMSEEEAKQLGDAKIGEVMAIADPHWRERYEATSVAMGEAFRPMMERMEPVFRELYTQSYARRFGATELRAILDFVSTDTGGAFIQHQWRMTMDPEFMKTMMARLPEMMADLDFASMQQTMDEALADLPPPREFNDLTAQEKTRLAQLLGISVSELKQNWEARTSAIVIPAPSTK